MLFMLILFPYLSMFIKMSFSFKSLLKPINHITSWRSKTDSKPSQILVTIEPSNYLFTPHDHPTAFLSKIRMNMFKPLRLPCHLNPYPLDCLEYLPQFSEGNQFLAERHLESFENFVDQFKIVHDDVIIRLFSKSLFRDDVVWIKGLRADYIGSWTELSNDFSNH